MARVGLAVTIVGALGAVSVVSITRGDPADKARERKLYTDAELADARKLYTTNLEGNFYDLVERLDEPLRGRARGVKLELPDRSDSPLQFHAVAALQKVYAPIGSVKFVDDLMTALAWRTQRSCDASAVFDYAGMLSIPARVTGLPSPLQALGVPADVLRTDAAVYEDSGKLLKSAIYFLLAHELGHVLLGHPGNRAVPPATSQLHERQADAFALDAMAKVGVVPVGMVPYFRAAAYYEGPAGTLERSEYRRIADALSTHPLAASRIDAIASGVRRRRDAFAARNPARVVDDVAAQIEGIATFLDDPPMRNFQALRSRDRPLSSIRRCAEWTPTGAR
jgi:hypothetical protein